MLDNVAPIAHIYMGHLIFPNQTLYIHIAGLQVQPSPIVEKNSPNDVGFYPSSKPIEKDQKSQQASN
jgi:hypothetical protein